MFSAVGASLGRRAAPEASEALLRLFGDCRSALRSPAAARPVGALRTRQVCGSSRPSGARACGPLAAAAEEALPLPARGRASAGTSAASRGRDGDASPRTFPGDGDAPPEASSGVADASQAARERRLREMGAFLDARAAERPGSGREVGREAKGRKRAGGGRSEGLAGGVSAAAPPPFGAPFLVSEEASTGVGGVGGVGGAGGEGAAGPSLAGATALAGSGSEAVPSVGFSSVPTGRGSRSAHPGGAGGPEGSLASFVARAAASPAPASIPPPPALDWRGALAAMRAAGTPVPSGPDALVDSFGRAHRYLRVSLTERCNLRCTYCMPAEGVELTPSPELLTPEETTRVVRAFAACGVDKVRLTGGEPTVRRDLVEVVRGIASVPGIRKVAMTTNGIVLERSLAKLRDAGLTGLNVSLDSLREDRFLALARRPGLRRVLSAIDAAAELGYAPVKVNVVVRRGVNDDEAVDFAKLVAGRPINVRFIEHMPFDGVAWRERDMVPYAELLARIEEGLGGKLRRLDDPKNEVARNYVIPDELVEKVLREQGREASLSFPSTLPTWAASSARSALPTGAASSARSALPTEATASAAPPPSSGPALLPPSPSGSMVSFVASMTAPFCAGCDRIRLMADGNLKVCLFGASEVSLRDAMREGCSDDDLRLLALAALGRKKKAHAGMHTLAKTMNRTMVRIGG